MRFTINLATRSYLDFQLINRILLLVVLLLGTVLVWKVLSFAGNWGELDRIREGTVALESRLNSRPAGVSEKDYTRQQKSIRFFNEAIEHKSYNWLALLDQLELATPEGIALAALARDTQSSSFKIEGRARNFGQVRAYLERLEQSKAFTDILLLSHGDLVTGEKSHGVHFTISCRAVQL